MWLNDLKTTTTSCTAGQECWNSMKYKAFTVEMPHFYLMSLMGTDILREKNIKDSIIFDKRNENVGIGTKLDRPLFLLFDGSIFVVI